MTLRKKAILSLATVLVITIGLLVAYIYINQLHISRKYENDAMKKLVDRAVGFVQNEITDISHYCREYAYWTATANFVQGKYPDYIDEQIVPATFTAYNISFLMIYNLDNELVYGIEIDPSNNLPRPAGSDITTYIENHRILPQPNIPDSYIEGLVVLPERTLMLTARSILDNSLKGPTYGTLIMGRYLDQESIHQLSTEALESIFIDRIDNPHLPPDFNAPLTELLSHSQQIVYNKFTGNRLAGYTLLPDILGNPALILRVDENRDIYKMTIIDLKTTLFGMSMVGLLALIFVIYNIDRLVLRPTENIESQTSAITASGDISKRLEFEGIDEFSQLSQSINNMLNSLELAQSELHGIFESTADGILVVDDSGKVIRSNSVFAEMWNIPQSLIDAGDDKALIEYILDQLENPEEFIQLVEEYYQSDKEGTDLLSFKDGRHVERHTRPILIGGKRSGRIWSFSDISTRWDSVAALALEKSRLEAIFESSPEGIVWTDTNGIIQSANSEFCSIFGYPSQEVMGKQIDQLVANPEMRGEAEKITARVSAGNNINIETVRYRKDGTPIQVSILCKPIQTGSETNLVYAIYRDITERKQSESDIQEAHRLQNILYQISNSSHAASDLNGLFEQIHHFLAQLMDTTNFYIAFYDKDSEMLSFPYWRDELDPQPEPQNHGNGLTEHVLNTKKAVYVSKADIFKMAKDGIIELFGTPSEQWIGVPLVIDNKAVGAIVVQSYEDPDLYSRRDLDLLGFVSNEIATVMMHKRTEEQVLNSEKHLRNLSQQLQDSNTLKELLLDVITHDLKNPAGVIKNMASMALEEHPEDEALKIITQSSANLLDVIENATTLSQISLGDTIQVEDLDLSKMVGRIVNEFQPSLKHNKMKLTNLITDSLPVLANPIIGEVFRNYLSNALKYALDGKKLELRSSFSGDLARIEFVDFGHTIPEDKREMIFLRQTQLETGIKFGRGLGLSIVRKIAEAHGARVGVAPNSPAGNIFFLEINLRKTV